MSHKSSSYYIIQKLWYLIFHLWGRHLDEACYCTESSIRSKALKIPVIFIWPNNYCCTGTVAAASCRQRTVFSEQQLIWNLKSHSQHHNLSSCFMIISSCSWSCGAVVWYHCSLWDVYDSIAYHYILLNSIVPRCCLSRVAGCSLAAVFFTV